MAVEPQNSREELLLSYTTGRASWHQTRCQGHFSPTQWVEGVAHNGWLQPHILEGSHCPLRRAHLSRLSVQSTVFLRKHSAFFVRIEKPAPPLVRLLWLLWESTEDCCWQFDNQLHLSTCVHERGAQRDILEMVMPAPALAGYRPTVLTCQRPRTTPWF